MRRKSQFFLCKFMSQLYLRLTHLQVKNINTTYTSRKQGQQQSNTILDFFQCNLVIVLLNNNNLLQWSTFSAVLYLFQNNYYMNNNKFHISCTIYMLLTDVQLFFLMDKLFNYVPLISPSWLWRNPHRLCFQVISSFSVTWYILMISKWVRCLCMFN